MIHICRLFIIFVPYLFGAKLRGATEYFSRLISRFKNLASLKNLKSIGILRHHRDFEMRRMDVESAPIHRRNIA